MKTTFFISTVEIDREMFRNIRLGSYVRQRISPKHNVKSIPLSWRKATASHK
jgi:hypothetical protein